MSLITLMSTKRHKHSCHTNTQSTARSLACSVLTQPRESNLHAEILNYLVESKKKHAAVVEHIMVTLIKIQAIIVLNTEPMLI